MLLQRVCPALGALAAAAPAFRAVGQRQRGFRGRQLTMREQFRSPVLLPNAIALPISPDTSGVPATYAVEDNGHIDAAQFTRIDSYLRVRLESIE